MVFFFGFPERAPEAAFGDGVCERVTGRVAQS